MGSTANKFVSQSLILALLISMGSLTLPASTYAQGSREGIVLEQELKEATRVLRQRQREAARAQEQGRLQQRLAGQFAILLVQGKAQHAMIAQWKKAHAGESRIKTTRGVHKKRFLCQYCFD
jgi:type II secretory pathway pseudopilin PulG